MTEEEFSDVIAFSEFENVLGTADEITYLTIGTLTNLAALLKREKLKKRFGKILVMGGGLGEFNCSHETEFNFSKDAEAVRILLNSGLDVTLFPLDITNHQRLSNCDIDELETVGIFPEYITFLRHNLKANTLYDGIPAAVLHDTLPVLYLSYPEKFTVTDMHLTSDGFGHIEQTDNGNTLHVCTAVSDGLLKHMMSRAFKESKLK